MLDKKQILEELRIENEKLYEIKTEEKQKEKLEKE